MNLSPLRIKPLSGRDEFRGIEKLSIINQRRMTNQRFYKLNFKKAKCIIKQHRCESKNSNYIENAVKGIPHKIFTDICEYHKVLKLCQNSLKKLDIRFDNKMTFSL
jgi:hypothetical protein